MSSEKKNSRRLLNYYWPYRWQFALAFLMVGIHSAIPATLVILIQKILDDALIQQNEKMLLLLPISLCGLYLLNGILSFGRGMLTQGISWKVVSQLRFELFQHMIYLPIKWRQKQSIGKLLSTLSHDINQIQYAVSAIITAIQKPLTLIGLIAAAFYMNAQLAGIGLILLPLVGWPISHFGKRLREAAQSERDQQAILQETAAESLLGLQTLKTHVAEPLQTDKFQHHNQMVYQQKLRAISARLLPSAVVEFIAAIGIGLAIYFGGQWVLEGKLLPGELIAFMVALGLLNAPLKGLSELQSLWQRAMVGADSLFQVLDIPQSDFEKGRLFGNKNNKNIEIEFQHVHFDYGEEKVLQDVSFTIKPNEIFAIEGPSGCGKSTIASLLLRFYHPQKGQIRIAQTQISEYQIKSLRQNISIVFQHSFLFHTTIWENLTMGKDFSTDEIDDACQKAQIYDFIMQLPQQYQTLVQEGGQRLSGGQRQRICIARAILYDAPIVILDEPTSQLDTKAATEIMTAIQNLIHNKTVILISHNPQMLALATNRFVFPKKEKE